MNENNENSIEKSDTTGRTSSRDATLAPTRPGALDGTDGAGDQLQVGSLSPSQLLEGIEADGFTPEQKDQLFCLRDPQLSIPSHERRMIRTGTEEKNNEALEKELRVRGFQWLKAETMMRSHSLDSTLKFRLPMAWRILRTMLRYSGRCGLDAPLIECMEGDADNSDPWKYPDRPSTLTPKVRNIPDAWTEALVRMTQLDDKWKTPMRTANGKVVAVDGLGYLPPPVPMGSRGEDGYPLKHYDPSRFERDPGLHWWCESVQAIMDRMDIGEGIRGNRELAEAAMFGLASPILCRHAWPTPQQLIEFEEDFMEAIVEILASGDGESGKRSGNRRAVKYHLETIYGIRGPEADSICRMAEGHVVSNFEGDKEHQRALMAHRLEDFIDRAKKSGDLSREIMGIARLSSILGIVKGVGEGSDDIMDDVRKVIEEQDAGNMPSYEADATFLPEGKK